MKTILTELERFNVPVRKVVPMTENQVPAIHLGGTFDGVCILIYPDHYDIVRESKDQDTKRVRGVWLLDTELKKVMA